MSLTLQAVLLISPSLSSVAAESSSTSPVTEKATAATAAATTAAVTTTAGMTTAVDEQDYNHGTILYSRFFHSWQSFLY